VEAFFSNEYRFLWAPMLALLLFYPVRQLIWTLYVRKASQLTTVDETESLRLKKRATITSILVCLVFSVLYSSTLLKG
jgi:Na+/proline symporter